MAGAPMRRGLLISFAHATRGQLALASVCKMTDRVIANKTGFTAKLMVRLRAALMADGFAGMSPCATIGGVCDE